jgi:pimeloyl-ACP methyl ester carboxylesterase
MRRAALLGILTLSLFSCGGSLQTASDAPTQVEYNPVERSYLVFDPYSTEAQEPIGIPFPNDLFWAKSGGLVQFDLSSVDSPAQRALFEAINQLKVAGLSPNAPLFVPLSSDRPLDLNSVKGRFKLIDVSALSRFLGGDPQALSLIDQSDRLFVRQEGRYLKFYPIKPLEAGDRYLMLLLNGITDREGKELLPAAVYDELESDKPLADPDLEKLRELYRSEIYGKLLPALNGLAQKGLISIPQELNESSVLESFTFTTANKTLSLADLGAIKAYLEGELPELTVSGLPYSQVAQDYGSVDQAVDALAQFILSNQQLVDFLRSNRLFPAFSVSKLPELLKAVNGGQQVELGDYCRFIPVFFGNLNNYRGTVYIFQHGLGGDRKRAEALLQDISLPVVAIDLPYHGDYLSPTQNDSPNPDCLDETGTYATGKCFLTANVAADRVNLYQAAFNLRLLEKLLKGGLYDLTGAGNGTAVQTVDFVGQSMGAIVGASFVAKGGVYKSVLNVGGANLVSIVDSAENELIEGLLTATNLKKNTNAYAVTLGVFQMVLDPADPIYVGETYSNSTVVQSAYGDTVVPLVSNAALAKRVGFDSWEEVDLDSPQAAPGWYMFGNETNWVTHSFLTRYTLDGYPEVAGHTTEEFVKRAEEAARKQIEEFFSQ